KCWGRAGRALGGRRARATARRRRARAGIVSDDPAGYRARGRYHGLTREELHMIEHRLDTANSILYLRPKSALTPAAFRQLATTAGPDFEPPSYLRGSV